MNGIQLSVLPKRASIFIEVNEGGRFDFVAEFNP
jgi:hypothetical protein